MTSSYEEYRRARRFQDAFKAGRAGMDRALKNAGPEWTAMAYRMTKAHVRVGEELIGEDIRMRLVLLGLPEPKRGSWGGFINSVLVEEKKKKKLPALMEKVKIEYGGAVYHLVLPTTDVRSHGRATYLMRRIAAPDEKERT